MSFTNWLSLWDFYAQNKSMSLCTSDHNYRAAYTIHPIDMNLENSKYSSPCQLLFHLLSHLFFCYFLWNTSHWWNPELQIWPCPTVNSGNFFDQVRQDQLFPPMFQKTEILNLKSGFFFLDQMDTNTANIKPKMYKKGKSVSKFWLYF